MNSSSAKGPAGPAASPANPTAAPSGERLAHLFRRCTQAGHIHPLQHLIQQHLQSRKT